MSNWQDTAWNRARYTAARAAVESGKLLNQLEAASRAHQETPKPHTLHTLGAGALEMSSFDREG